MKLYEINLAIEEVIEDFLDIETGEIIGDVEEMERRLDALEMEKDRILEYLAKLVINYRAEQNAIKDEVKRLEAKEERLLGIIDRECGGVKRDLGVATATYRRSTATVVDNAEQAINWLETHGYDDALKYTAPAVVKSKAKELIQNQKIEILGVHLEEKNNMSLK